MSRLVRLTSRWVAKPASTPRKKTTPLRVSPDGRRTVRGVADANALDVAFFDIGAHPQVVGIDEREKRLARRHHFALAHRTHVHDSLGGRMDFAVREADDRFVGLRGGRGARLLHSGELAPFDRHLVGGGAGQRQRRSLGLELPLGHVELRPARFEDGALPVHLLDRHGAGRYQLLHPGILDLRVLEVGRCLRALGLHRRQVGRRLTNLLFGFPLLIVEGSLALFDLNGDAFRAV
jgi:hypothetical protein